MFGMGTTLNLKEVNAVLKKPSLIVLTIFLQFTIMPLLAITICKIFDFSKEITLGFLILGACREEPHQMLLHTFVELMYHCQFYAHLLQQL